MMIKNILRGFADLLNKIVSEDTFAGPTPEVAYKNSRVDLPTRSTKPRPANRHAAKLTDDEARAIRLSSESTHALVDRYGVSKSTINDVRAGKSYRHITVPAPNRSKERRAKLTKADVVAIRTSQEPGTKLAPHYGVSIGTIYSIRQRRSWKDIG